MIRNWMLAALAAGLLGPLVPEPAAQEPAPRPRARARVERGPFVHTQRGRIGVVVQTEAQAADDRVGAKLEAVTPGGPADKAGLRAGDIITRFGGTALGGVEAEEEGESGPGVKLIELARALEPGDTVPVEYRRGTDNRRATIVAEDLGTSFGFTVPRVEPGLRRLLDDLGHGPRVFGWALGDGWGQLELVTLNPDLGEYFGTREGVLVVKAPTDTSDGLPLRGGDVILSIGGRKPGSPSHAMRILRSYEPGETVAIEIMRKQRRSTVNWQVPERAGRLRAAPRMDREEPTRWRISPDVPIRIRDVIRTIAI